LPPGWAFRLRFRGGQSSPDWTRAIETALGKTGSLAARKASAERALALAQSAGWQDGRTAFSHFAVGRLLGRVSDPGARWMPLTGRRSIPGCRGASCRWPISTCNWPRWRWPGLSEDAVRLADRAIPVVRRHENALLATLMLIKAEALEQLGETAGAAALRLDSSALGALWLRP
jgi:hypothetical protein